MIQCQGQTYKTAEIILLCHKVLGLCRTVAFTSELIARRHGSQHGNFHVRRDLQPKLKHESYSVYTG